MTEFSDDSPEQTHRSDLHATPPPPPSMTPFTAAEPDSFEPPARRPRWLVALAVAAVAIVVLMIVAGPLVLRTTRFGRELTAMWHLQKAEADYRRGKIDEALRQAERAVVFSPDNAMVVFRRAYFRSAAGDLAGSLADYDRLIELSPNYAEGYTGRGIVYQRLDRHDEAIADFERAMTLRPDFEPEPKNNLAYARALAGKDLEQGLTEVERAIELADDEVAAYLDTRGYLRHLLGDHEAALTDLNRAIELEQRDRDELLASAKSRSFDQDELDFLQRRLDEQLSVLLRHRAEVYQALARDAEAAADFQKSKALGYDPQRGVY